MEVEVGQGERERERESDRVRIEAERSRNVSIDSNWMSWASALGRTEVGLAPTGKTN